MPRGQRRPGWIDWRNSRAKQCVLDDLENGELPLEENDFSAQDAWDYIYSDQPEFMHVDFSQFEARLKDHRKQVKKRVLASTRQQAAFERDRNIYPQRTIDRRGRLIFDSSTAKLQLREDISNELHNQMTTEELYHRHEVYYNQFTLEEFRPRVYQEIRRQKFVYYLAWKQAKKNQQRGQPEVFDESEEESSDEEDL